MCGLVPAGGDNGATAECLAALRPVGLVAVAVFRPDKRPQGSERNVAMVYTVGPNCGTTAQKKARRDVDRLSPADFLLVLESIGGAVATALASYNTERSGVPDAPGEALPRIDVCRVCLVSGGVYRHPAVSKEEVAGALLRGLIGRHEKSTNLPCFNFAWDDDCFRNAWLQLTQEGALPSASQASQ